MNRTRTFQKWLTDLTPEKVAALSELEKAARLVTHVKRLTGDADEKLIATLCNVSDTLRDLYEEKPSSKPDIQPK